MFPNLTVAENIAFQNVHNKRGLIRWKKSAEVAQRGMAEIGFEIDINRRVETLSVAQQQLVEIARAMMRPLKLLIIDEPTSSLTQKDVNSLFRLILN
jgi:simple sugar transport system ATP-binding protein